MGRPPLPQPPTAASYLRVGRTAARRRAEATGAQLEWREADAEHLPFDDEEFDVVMSCIGAMCAPHHRDVADELVRVCRPGGFVGLAKLDPGGDDRRPVPCDAPLSRRLLLRARHRPAVGVRGAPPRPVRGPVEFTTLDRRVLNVTAFRRPTDWGEHFTQLYGPTITTRANARRDGREREFDDALAAFCREWNLGTDDQARFEHEYLLAVGRRV